MENPTQPHFSLTLTLSVLCKVSHLGSRSGFRILTSLINNQVSISDFFSTLSCSRSHLKATDSFFGSNFIRHTPSSPSSVPSTSPLAAPPPITPTPSNVPTGTSSHRRKNTPLSSPSLSLSLLLLRSLLFFFFFFFVCLLLA